MFITNSYSTGISTAGKYNLCEILIKIYTLLVLFLSRGYGFFIDKQKVSPKCKERWHGKRIRLSGMLAPGIA